MTARDADIYLGRDAVRAIDDIAEERALRLIATSLGDSSRRRAYRDERVYSGGNTSDGRHNFGVVTAGVLVGLFFLWLIGHLTFSVDGVTYRPAAIPAAPIGTGTYDSECAAHGGWATPGPLPGEFICHYADYTYPPRIDKPRMGLPPWLRHDKTITVDAST
jgi:hypothetical protein